MAWRRVDGLYEIFRAEGGEGRGFFGIIEQKKGRGKAGNRAPGVNSWQGKQRIMAYHVVGQGNEITATR